MHEFYQTPALVLRHSPIGESSALLTLLTRDLGLVYGHAQGLREQRSKLRYSLQESMVPEVTLVRGKSAWRVIGAQELALRQTSSAEQRFTARKIMRLIERLLSDEVADEHLYQIVTEGLVAIEHSTADVVWLEYVLVLRILHTLGYVAPCADEHNIIHLLSGPYAALTSHDTPQARKLLLSLINEALSVSQL